MFQSLLEVVFGIGDEGTGGFEDGHHGFISLACTFPVKLYAPSTETQLRLCFCSGSGTLTAQFGQDVAAPRKLWDPARVPRHGGEMAFLTVCPREEHTGDWGQA